MTSLEIDTLHHVSIPVSDLARAKHFYGHVLGLLELPRPPFPFDGAWYRAGDRELHLIVAADPTFRTGKGPDTQDTHFALRVRSFRAALAYLESQGFRPDADGPGRSMRVNAHSVVGYPQAYLLDPDRNVIEINAAELD